MFIFLMIFMRVGDIDEIGMWCVLDYVIDLGVFVVVFLGLVSEYDLLMCDEWLGMMVCLGEWL